MEKTLEIFKNDIFIMISGSVTLLTIVGFAYIVILWAKGAIPVLIRMGMGLATRKIGIFSNNNYDSLKDLLKDSKLFKVENIFQIHTDSIGRAETMTVLLLDWDSMGDQLDAILQIKNDAVPLLVYSDHNIPKEVFNKIRNERNTTVVNFRGRLLNDLVAAMITTDYKSK